MLAKNGRLPLKQLDCRLSERNYSIPVHKVNMLKVNNAFMKDNVYYIIQCIHVSIFMFVWNMGNLVTNNL